MRVHSEFLLVDNMIIVDQRTTIMKKYNTILLPFFFLLSGILAACSSSDDDGPLDGEIWDIMPFNINFAVTDSQGNDLLDPAHPNTIANNGIKVTFGNIVLTKDSGVPVVRGTRAIYTEFYGLRGLEHKGKYYLSLGEFKGDQNYQRQRIVIDWNDNSKKDTIYFNHSFWWSKHQPKQSTHIYWEKQEFDGDSIITIVKE